MGQQAAVWWERANQRPELDVAGACAFTMCTERWRTSWPTYCTPCVECFSWSNRALLQRPKDCIVLCGAGSYMPPLPSNVDKTLRAAGHDELKVAGTPTICVEVDAAAPSEDAKAEGGNAAGTSLLAIRSSCMGCGRLHNGRPDEITLGAADLPDVDAPTCWRDASIAAGPDAIASGAAELVRTDALQRRDAFGTKHRTAEARQPRSQSLHLAAVSADLNGDKSRRKSPNAQRTVRSERSKLRPQHRAAELGCRRGASKADCGRTGKGLMTPIRGFGLGDAPRTWQRFDDLSESTGGWRSHAIRTLFGWAPA